MYMYIFCIIFFLSLLSSFSLISPLILASTSILRATDGNPMTDLKLDLYDFDVMESSSPRKTLSCQLRQMLNVIWSRLKLLTSGMYSTACHSVSLSHSHFSSIPPFPLTLPPFSLPLFLSLSSIYFFLSFPPVIILIFFLVGVTSLYRSRRNSEMRAVYLLVDEITG